MTYRFETLDPAVVELPAQVVATVQAAGRCVVVSATSEDRLEAYLVGAPDLRWVELLRLGDPARGWDGPAVSKAGRFVFLAQHVMYNRIRYFSEDDDDPSGTGLITESLLYREPDQLVSRIETTARGLVSEHVVDHFDTSAQYAPKPAAGDWAFFVTFAQEYDRAWGS